MSTVPSAFQVGDRVKTELGHRTLTGVVVEDRGPLGVGGRHLYVVHVPADPFDPMALMLREDEMEAAGPEVTPDIEKHRIIAYLENGGLISILRANMSGGKNQPRVWLRLDNLGNVTHTFVPERGVIGGEVIPFSALHENRVFTPKEEAVVSFLQSFGLSRRDAHQVISAVGTAP